MKKHKITIGRSTDCDLVLADMSVSRLHAELELLENGQLLLTDCHSSQGTFVIRGDHEVEVKQQTVSNLDLLKFGNITLPVNEILTVTHLYQQNAVEVEKPVQKLKATYSMKVNPNNKHQLDNNAKTTENLAKLYFSFEGRISRSTYWLKYMLPYFVIYILLTILDKSTGSFDYTMGYGTTSGLFTLAAIFPGLVMATKRCHDRDRTGWFQLVLLIPLVNIWPLIELSFLKGSGGSNKYGVDPLL